jgi:uncharacterized RDD family membrane protein YckC
METVEIDTTQNIQLELPVASIGDRFVAHLIDYGVYFAYYIVGIILFGILSVAGINSIALFIILLLPLVLYDLVCELAFNGQNIGKRVMKIKVVMRDGSQPTFMPLFIRWIFRVLENVLFFGSISTLTIILNGRGQRLGDLAAGTAVIKIQKASKASDLGDYHLPDNYEPAFKEAANLTEKDFKIITEIIQFRNKAGASQPVFNASIKAKKKLEERLGIISNLPALEFLQTLRSDYIYFNRK